MLFFRAVKRHLQAGVFVVLAGVLMGAGCKDNSDAQTKAPALGIPESEYDLFASLIRNVDEAALEVDRVRPTKNRVALRRAQAKLVQNQEIVVRLFTKKYGGETISRWTTMVHAADSFAARRIATQVKGEELLTQFQALGATGNTDTEGYITHLNCRNILLPEEMFPLIANCFRLQDLNLKKTGFKDSHFDHLANLTELFNLDLSDNPISGAAINKLGGMTRLNTLNLARTSVSDDNVQQFEAISHLKNIRMIDISSTKLGTASYEKITRFFRLADVKY
jgi:Leucine-rich repeat (LRR) protein